MTEQEKATQERIDKVLGVLMGIPASCREGALSMAQEIAEMSAEERGELGRTVARVALYAPKRIRQPRDSVPTQRRKRGPKPVTAVAG